MIDFISQAVNETGNGAPHSIDISDTSNWTVVSADPSNPFIYDHGAAVARIAALQAEQPWKALRAERNRRLAETDWVTLQAVDASVDGFGVQLPVLWMTYRQELRDLPAHTTDPANPVWPTKPGGAA